MSKREISIHQAIDNISTQSVVAKSLLSAVKNKIGNSGIKQQHVARRLIVDSALKEAYEHFEIEDLRSLNSIKKESELLLNDINIRNDELHSKVYEIVKCRKTPFHSQVLDFCKEAGLDNSITERCHRAIDVLRSSYAVFGFQGVPFFACKTNCIYPEKLVELCSNQSLDEVLERPESSLWGMAIKDPCRYAPSRKTFLDSVLYNLEQEIDGSEALSLVRTALTRKKSDHEVASLRTVLITQERPDYVKVIDDIKDWAVVADAVSMRLADLTDEERACIGKYPKTRTYSIDIDVELPEGVQQRHDCPLKLRYKINDWIHGMGADIAEAMPSNISLSWDFVEARCPDFITESFTSVEIMQYLSKRLKVETLQAVDSYRKWKSSGQKYMPYQGEYYSTDEGVEGLIVELASSFIRRSFQSYDCIHDVLDVANTPEVYKPFSGLKEMIEGSSTL
ncbi:hypothetical protein [Vibrio sp. D431a]|uniref:hypothetical protein n=1 Tax=Vibrio sp. D431a TaxID=2837388 RepID=UPI0025572688|nr:hypothetical protein [Vibrio sp. D431a]MDK9789985.1 hypothetical protein [Vibrio sp. D431a]